MRNFDKVSVKVLNLFKLYPVLFCLLKSCVGQINSEITVNTNNCIKLNINKIEKNSAEVKKEILENKVLFE